MEHQSNQVVAARGGVLVFCAALTAATLLSGCGTRRAVVSPEIRPDPNMAMAVVIPPRRQGENEMITVVENRHDPVEVIRFARSLSAIGRNRDAAEIYLDAARRFPSVGGKFESDCRKAAVREFWLEGDFRRASELLDELERTQDIYMRASEEDGIRKLRKLLETSESFRNAAP